MHSTAYSVGRHAALPTPADSLCQEKGTGGYPSRRYPVRIRHPPSYYKPSPQIPPKRRGIPARLTKTTKLLDVNEDGWKLEITLLLKQILAIVSEISAHQRGAIGEEVDIELYPSESVPFKY